MGAEVDALYEIGRHASGSHEIPCERDETAQASGGSSGEGGGVLSYLSFQGVSKLRERWSRYSTLGGSKRRKRCNAASLFVSRNAEYVAVAVGNRITILRKGDGYVSPCGIYTNNNRMAFFTNGAWLEDQGIFGVVDDLNSLYLIKENGDALTRRTSNQLKLSSPIVDMLAQDASGSQRGFYICTTDCTVHKFDYTEEPDATLYQVSIVTKDAPSTRPPQLPKSLSCVDYHQDHSLVVLVGDSSLSSSSNGSSGAYFLYILHFDGYLELRLSFQSMQLKGLFSAPTDKKTLVSVPKVRISPQGKCIATLDLNGSVNIFVLDGNMRSVSLRPHGSGTGTHLIGVKDISWWTDSILMVVKEDGRISMYSIAENIVVSKDDPVLSTPLLEKAKAIAGYAFVLQSSRQVNSVPGDHQHAEMEKIFWSLVSFSKVTVLEMYSVLIRENRQKEALDFAMQYNLDKDDVLKACWLHAAGDIHDIQSYLANIKDQSFVLSECVNKVAPTEVALKALFSLGLRITDRYNFSEPDKSSEGSAWDYRIIRLRLLWYNDLLETFMGINMGRFSAGEYNKFRLTPLVETAIALAESGKIGALNLLMKRHPYTISSDILHVLSAIPETIAVQTYSQLLPGKYPPSIVPKPTHFFLTAHLDEKNVKQLIRLILSKFGRRQPVRSDNEWANMWRDLKLFQEKAFPFLDSEYMLAEFIRGLLKAGKFSLARNYLGGTSAVSLSTEKAENLVIQAAREYFFSASTLSCNEVKTDIIDALTVRLPSLGVTILPVQFRQVKDPMEIIRMVITSQTGAYLHFEEIIDVAKLLGLRSEEEIAAVEEAIAREAVVNGDLHLAFDLCLNLIKKGHGQIWDLCSAIARGPQLDNLDTSTRKMLLGFSLSHCDGESVGELLNAWKELDVRDKFEQLMVLTGTNPPNFFVDGSTYTPLPVQSVQDILDLREDISHDRDHDHVAIAKEMLSKVCMDLTNDDTYSWESAFAENRKLLSFSALELPWLLKLSNGEMHDGNEHSSETNHPIRRYRFSTKTEATNSIIYWLGVNSFAPSDDLIMFLAKSVMEPPVDEDDYILSCSILLNLMDPFNGVKTIEEELKNRECYQEISSIMNVGMTYSSLNSSKKECSTPEQRRNLLLHKFHEKFTSIDSDELDQIDMVHATYWGEWKSKLEEEKRMADQARVLKNVLPDIDTSRFLSGDANYIKKVVFSFVDSVKLERKHILKEAVKIAENYGLHRTEVLLRFLGCALVSEYWNNDDILNEISEFREDIVKSAKGVIDMIYSDVYPEIDGHNKQRLSYIFGILSACHSYLKRTSEIELTYQEHVHTHKLELFQYYKVLEEECKKVCFIDHLNYKNIASLDNLNFEHFNEEVCQNIHASTVSALADMVQALVSMYVDVQAKGLVSRQGVYKHYVLGMLSSLEGRNEARSNSTDCEKLQAFLCEIEVNYDSCKEYIQTLPATDISYIIGRYCTLCFPCNLSRSHPHEPSWKKPLCMLITLWVKLLDDIPRQSTVSSYERTGYLDPNRLSHCMSAFRQLLINDEITVHQGWDAISMFVQAGFNSEMIIDTSHICRAMILSGCAFKTVVEVYYGGQEHLESMGADSRNPLDLLELYGASTDGCLSDLIGGSCESEVLLHKLLSSLSQSAGEDASSLEMIRTAVWGKLTTFSENMQLGSQLRVYALQLMQCITGSNLKSLPNEIVSQVEPWESWYEPGTSASIADEGTTPSSSITATLVALRSSQMITAVLPDASITPENLSSLDSAVSCFLHLSERASSVESVAVLEAVLEEWEQLFSSKEEFVAPLESPKEASDWSDGWDDGWEALPEELENPTQKQDDASSSVHPLHGCWMEIIRKLAAFGDLQKIIELLDHASSKHGLLLEDEEAHRLLDLVSAANCFMALKILLLLPYEAPQLKCLQMVDAKIREGTVSTSSSAEDHELLALVLSSGSLQKIAAEDGYSKLFSHICHLVGQLSRSFQNDLCIHWEAESNSSETSKISQSLLFGKVLLPCFISELVLSGQYLLAGFVVSRWMHIPPSLGLIDVIEPSVRRYLEGQVAQAQQQVGESHASLAENELSSISRTLSSLRLKMIPLLQTALVALPNGES
uniref:Uncharacterized protein n=1 Tax=Avena sativa TaxID=4498 RepID=A0ACD5ZJK6_AVESA